MKNIVQLLAHAKSQVETWTPVEVKRCLASIAIAYPDWRLDWEEGDEHWIRVISDKKLLGYISVELPIAFFQGDGAKNIRWEPDGLPTVHTVADFDSPDISTTRHEMEDIFGRTLTHNLDYGCLSLNDLWWATVS